MSILGASLTPRADLTLRAPISASHRLSRAPRTFLLAAVLIRTMQDVMGTPLTLGTTPLGVMEPLIYAAVMEGDGVFPGMMMADRLDGAFRRGGLTKP